MATYTPLDGAADKVSDIDDVVNAALIAINTQLETHKSRHAAGGGDALTAAGLPTAIDAAKIADGTVSNTEFQYVNGVTSAIQTQIDGKASKTVSATDKVLGRETAGSGDVEEIACTAAGRALLDDANAAAQIATLGLDADIATLSLPANTTITAFAQSVLDDADEATFKATVNLEIGTDVQAYDAELAALAGLTSAANKIPKFTGSGTATLINHIAWTDWTPSWTNLTVGNGTVTARYTQIDKTVFGRLTFVFGSSSAVSGTVSFTLPATAVSYAGTAATQPMGIVNFFDTGTAQFGGVVCFASTTTARVYVYKADGTYIQNATLSSTVPMTWATGDELSISFTYEVA